MRYSYFTDGVSELFDPLIVPIYFGPKANQRPIVVDAKRIPRPKAPQNPRPICWLNANGMKNGRPSGTRISVSRASCETVSICCSFHQTATNATILTIGSVSSKAPSRGNRSASWETAATTKPATIARKIINPFFSGKATPKPVISLYVSKIPALHYRHAFLTRQMC